MRGGPQSHFTFGREGSSSRIRGVGGQVDGRLHGGERTCDKLLQLQNPNSVVSLPPPPQTHFSLKLTATDKDRLVYISGSYSKARTSGAQFHGDSDEKDKKASPMVVEAAGMFMKEGFDELQALEASREL